MRLTPTQIDTIHSTAQAVLGEGAKVTLFGSRVDDLARGGDVDLMIEVSQALAEPALMSARISSRLSCAFEGRHVDVLLKAPNLQEQAIHRVAEKMGLPL
jgi:predicted nucleotidyltransferase